MAENTDRTKKGQFEGVVAFNRRIAERFYRLGILFDGNAARIIGRTGPGQFVQIDLSGAALPPAKKIPADLADSAGRKILLRRPFSFADVSKKDGKVLAEILYCVVGPASLRMTTLAKRDTVNIIGPLGNGFSIDKSKKYALLVSGGMGAGPLIHLGKDLANKSPEAEIIVFAGAKTKAELPFEGKLDEISQTLGFALGEFAKYGIQSLVATDDGSAGYKGFVTDCLRDWLDKEKPVAKITIIFGCGPEAMLSNLAKTANEKNIDCQVSMERMMACGIGLCQSCAVECKENGSSETVYKMCCSDGPVFDSREIVFKS